MSVSAKAVISPPCRVVQQPATPATPPTPHPSTAILTRSTLNTTPQQPKSRKRGHDSTPLVMNKKERLTNVVLGDQVTIARRTKYAKLFEAMAWELAAVKYQLQLAQQRLEFHEQTINTNTETDEPTRSRRPSEDSNPHPHPHPHPNANPNSNSPLSFNSLLPQTRHVMLMSQTHQALHEETYLHAPILFWKMDLRHRILDANIAFCETHGWELSELLGCLLPPGNPVKAMYPPQMTFPHTRTAPLKNGVPVGLSALDLLPSRDVLTRTAQLYRQEASYVTYSQRWVNAKGELCQSRVTCWLVYESNCSYSTLDPPCVPSSSSSPCSSLPSSSSTGHSACESLLFSYYSSLCVDPDTNPYVPYLIEWFTPELVRCFIHDQPEEMIAATLCFGKPLYLICATSPSDTVVLRHPASSHPLDETCVS